MTLYMKQKIVAFKDRFYVKDERGRDRYYIEEELLSLTKKLHIYDMDDNRLAIVQKKMISFLPKYIVTIDGEEVAEIVKEITFFKPSYKVKGPDWSVDGDIWDYDYKIRKGRRTVAEISKAILSFRDSYKIEIEDGVNPVLVMAVVLAIDCVLDAEGEDAARANNDED